MKIILLGIIQGLTEFLPVSSSGHLVVFKSLLGLKGMEAQNPVIEVSLHLGTLAAVLVYYHRDLAAALAWLFRWRAATSARAPGGNNGRQSPGPGPGAWLLWIAVGCVPTVLLGFGFKDFFERAFDHPIWVGFALCVTGLLCLSTRFVRAGSVRMENLGWMRSLAIGTAQGLAIMPGISRSGSTIVTGIVSGVEAREAGRYSFLLSVPAIAGAAVLELLKAESLQQVPFAALAGGVLASAAVGFLCLGLLTRLLKAGSFFYFGFYCIPLGLLVILHFAAGA